MLKSNIYRKACTEPESVHFNDFKHDFSYFKYGPNHFILWYCKRQTSTWDRPVVPRHTDLFISIFLLCGLNNLCPHYKNQANIYINYI